MGFGFSIGRGFGGINETPSSQSGAAGGGVDIGGIGSIATAITGIVNSGLNYDASLKNLAQQQKNLEYNQWLQQIAFGREDAATYRRTLDLKAAGLSPVLAAGQGASTGPIVSTQAPQREALQIPDAQLTLAAIQQGANITQTNAQTELLRQQARKSAAETVLTGVKSASEARDLQIHREAGIRSKPGWFAGTVSDLGGLIRSNLNKKFVEYNQKYGEAAARKWAGIDKNTPYNKQKNPMSKPLKK